MNISEHVDVNNGGVPDDHSSIILGHHRARIHISPGHDDAHYHQSSVPSGAMLQLSLTGWAVVSTLRGRSRYLTLAVRYLLFLTMNSRRASLNICGAVTREV